LVHADVINHCKGTKKNGKMQLDTMKIA
jgi:hypothetical protein